MKDLVSRRIGLALAVLAFAAAPFAHAFSLLGPFAPWMKPELGYHQKRDIGGPMNLGEEYRWTVPVVTYGFDQSFLDYFGQPGVDAVEQAIQILNALPPAAELSVTDYAFQTRGLNVNAAMRDLQDLKSRALALLVEQMGLAQATRYVWTLRQWDPDLFCPTHLDELSMEFWVGPTFTNYVNQRSYDPVTQQPISFVNARLHTFVIHSIGDAGCDAVKATPIPIDGAFIWTTPVSDGGVDIGHFYTGLTYDDVGGICYLLSRTNINVETLDDSILPAEGATNSVVRTAPRPGVEKTTFVRHATDAGGLFLTMTNRFDDLYITNGSLHTQRVCRVVGQPDVLFRAKDLGCRLFEYEGLQVYFPTDWQRTDTSRWINHAALNGNLGGDGPGVIRPPIEITFHTRGRYLAATGGSTSGTNFYFWNWASFGVSTNVTTFPGNQTNLTSLTLATRTFVTNATPTFEWTLLGRPGGHYRMEAATNLADWSALSTVTNLGGVFQFTHPLAAPRQFFRAVLEE